jgi:hypothetical protein
VTAPANKARGLPPERLTLPDGVRTGLDAVMDTGKTMTTISTDTDRSPARPPGVSQAVPIVR